MAVGIYFLNLVFYKSWGLEALFHHSLPQIHWFCMYDLLPIPLKEKVCERMFLAPV